MTRIDLGRKAVLKGEEGSSAGAFAEHLSDLIDAFEASREKPGDPLAWLALFFENMAQEKEVANLLCNLHSGKHGFLLLRIAKGLAGSNHDRRLGAAGAVKNCCFYPEMHEHIVKHDEMSALMVLPLVGPPDGYDDEDKDQMYPVSVPPPYLYIYISIYHLCFSLYLSFALYIPCCCKPEPFNKRHNGRI